MPIASISMPGAVLRTAKAANAPRTSQIKIGVGMPNTVPAPRRIRPSSLKVRIVPSVINCAMPRPATIRTSVATMG